MRFSQRNVSAIAWSMATLVVLMVLTVAALKFLARYAPQPVANAARATARFADFSSVT